MNDLSLYLHDLGSRPFLAADAERSLAAACAEGEEDARSRLIESNLRLVISIARRFVGRGLSLYDLVGEGNHGLLLAVDRCRLSFNTRFLTYATYFIEQSIRAAVINTLAQIRRTSHVFAFLTK